MNHLLRCIGSLVYLFVRGSSKVEIDKEKGVATKIYQPRFLIKLLYWLAFQASFPYKANIDALKVAGFRRQIADILLRYHYGSHYAIAAFLGLVKEGSGYGFKTEFIRGTAPRSQDEARQELKELEHFFQETGMPVWSITPLNPKAYQNVIRKADGSLWIIDLESNVVSPLLPKRYWLNCLREGYFPPFDDICFTRLRSYIAKEKEELGEDLSEKLERLLCVCEESTRKWQEREVRIWSRPLRVWLKAKASFSKLARETSRLGRDFLREGIENFLLEKRISLLKAKQLKNWLESEEAKPLLRHLGVHLGITLVPFMRLGLGSAARLLWTVVWRTKDRLDYRRGKINKTRYRYFREVHSLLVMVFTALPGIGAIAYIFARPIRRNADIFYIACDQFLRKISRGWYEKLRIALLIDILRLVSIDFSLYLFVVSWALGYGTAYCFLGRHWWTLAYITVAAFLLSLTITLLLGILKKLAKGS